MPIYSNIWRDIYDSVVNAHPDWDAELVMDEAEQDYASFINDKDKESGIWQ